jgi:cell division protease FtsH
VVPRFTPPEVQRGADERMGEVIAQAYAAARDMVRRNRAALDALVEALLERDSLQGEEVRGLVEAHAAQEDLDRRAAERAAFL